MSANAFIGKVTPPTAEELTSALGPAMNTWVRLIAASTDKRGVFEQEWKSYSPKSGWSLRLKRAKRNIAYLIPCTGSFSVSLVMGEKAMKGALSCDLPPAIADSVRKAVKYAEGSAFMMEVRPDDDIAPVAKLIMIKASD